MLYNIFPIPLHQVFMVFRFLGIISREAKVILRKKRFSFKVYVINRLTVRKKIFCVVQGIFFLYTYRSDNSYRFLSIPTKKENHHPRSLPGW